MKKIHSIQYLRAFAAISVLLFHGAGIIFRDHGVWDFGRYGVDIFFLISGFIMAFSIAKKPDHEDFFRRRILRIYPPYFSAMFFCYLLSNWTPATAFFHDVFDYTLFTFFDDFRGSPGKTHLPVAWTLYYEMFFYLICTFALWICRNPRNGMMVFFATTILLPDVVGITHLNTNLLLIFIAGFFFYEIREKLNVLDGLIIAICLIKISNGFENGPDRVVAIMASIGFVLALDKVKLPQIKALTFLGEASYSIYLLHYSLCFFVKKLLPSNQIAAELLFSFYMVLIIVISCLNYWFIERKITNFLVKRNDK